MIKSGEGKKVRNNSSTFEILFILVPEWEHFLPRFGQDHEGEDPGAFNRFQHPRR